ncbi:trigger factor [Candidatus Uhrbacteria bacterium RIFCSPLOWO2_02_FULL_48_18]|uniref:Trigger factor n=1 Tax=Candidatus Uhrbacteria bacterium RIFCSPLOWO2_02_FULL_48_18 TaxID=1802408 RepID=A0A1F7V7A1_9BACT|nr:MAG: trigger factor [Candidatus Uhrbacteria bacterium RIFCSPLOWO2_02_FULL_48_18]
MKRTPLHNIDAILFIRYTFAEIQTIFMPNITVEEQEKGLVKITFTVSVEEQTPFLEAAAEHISEHSTIPGFRPGKAGYEIVKQRVGETKIMEEALEKIVRSLFVKALLDNEIDTVGSPKIDVEKMAPGNELVFTAEVTRMPAVKELADFKSLSVQGKVPEVADHDVELALKDLTRMQTKEVRAASGSIVSATDKAVVSMDMKKDGVPIEGGQSPNHAVYLAEEYYIPGFKEQLIGLKEGDAKTFTLAFPADHAQAFLAGQDIDFEVVLKELFHLEPPQMDDSFAQSLGLKDFAMMRDLIHKNLLDEKIREEQMRQEKEALELIANKTQFENIPDLLLNEEIEKMLRELKGRVEEQGMDFEKYIQSLEKTLVQVKLDFTPQALMRIKVAIAMREIAKRENLTVSDEELDKELDDVAARYEDAEDKKRIYTPEYRQYFEQVVLNRKVIELVKNVMVKM